MKLNLILLVSKINEGKALQLGFNFEVLHRNSNCIKYMIAPTQIRKPENWQDFEMLCKKLWGELWKCSSSIKRNGRNGQNQCGVDIYGMPLGETKYFGIQCKGKDDYKKSKLTKTEIDSEIIKALNFQPPLKALIFATTADKDTSIEQYVRQQNIKQLENDQFSIDIFSWGDIVELLEECRSTYNWYINNCQYKDSTDVEVFIYKDKENEIHPEYIRTKKNYIKKPEMDLYKNQLFALAYKQSAITLSLIDGSVYNIFGKQKRKIDYRWCTIPFTLKNTGSTVIEDYKLYLVFESEKIEKIDDNYRDFNPGPLYDQSVVAAENIDRQKRREIFESTEFRNVIEIRPKNTTLVQDEHRLFKIGIKPKDNVFEISIKWILKSRDYKKEGVMILKVIPKYEDKKEYIEVENENYIKEYDIVIEPKILEV